MNWTDNLEGEKDVSAHASVLPATGGQWRPQNIFTGGARWGQWKS